MKLMHLGQQQGGVCAPVRVPEGLDEPALGQPLRPPLQLPHAPTAARRPLQGKKCSWSHKVASGHNW